MGNIDETFPLDILVKLEIVENVHISASYSPNEIKKYNTIFQEFFDVFAWSYEDMPGINLSIVVHEIKTYPDAKLIQKHLCLMHPKKVDVIKAEFEKLFQAGFIYLVPLTDWISNIVLVIKK